MCGIVFATAFLHANDCQAVFQGVNQIPEFRRPASEMTTQPVPGELQLEETGKLQGKVALLTYDDADLSRTAALTFAQAGADVAVVYRYELRDAEETKRLVEAYGCRCLLIPGGLAQENFARDAVRKTVAAFGKLDIFVNQESTQDRSRCTIQDA
jgi:hypothetical protein